jgi:hypothetical protein
MADFVVSATLEFSAQHACKGWITNRRLLYRGPVRLCWWDKYKRLEWVTWHSRDSMLLTIWIESEKIFCPALSSVRRSIVFQASPFRFSGKGYSAIWWGGAGDREREREYCESRLYGGTCSGILSIMIRLIMKIRRDAIWWTRAVWGEGVGAANACHFKETLKFIPGESAVVT